MPQTLMVKSAAKPRVSNHEATECTYGGRSRAAIQARAR